MRARERDVVVRAAGWLRDREEALLRRLAQYAHRDGTIMRGTPTRKLAAELGCSERTVERARASLIARGLLRVVSGGTGRESCRYELVLTPELAAEIGDTRRYPQSAVERFRQLSTQGRQPAAYKDPARAVTLRGRTTPLPKPSARELCRRHPDGPGRRCRACGTSSRQLGTNPRAQRTNPRAGYVTWRPPPAYVAPPAGVEPPAALLSDLRAQLTQRLTERSSA